MFCTKCGREILKGQSFCPVCGTRVGTIEDRAVPAANDGKKISSKYMWPMACSSLLLYLAAFVLLKAGIINSTVLIFIGFIINSVFLALDVRYLKSEGLEPGKWFWLGLILVPVYLGIRAAKTNKNYIPLIVEIK